MGKPLIVAGLGEVRAQLDRCFLPLGLQAEPGFGSRKYSGVVNCRTINITIAARTRTQYITGSIRYRKLTGLWMDVSVSTSVMSRLMLGQPGRWAQGVTAFVQRLNGNNPVTSLQSVYDPFVVYANDLNWAEIFLADTAVQNHLTTLMQNPDVPPGAAVFLMAMDDASTALIIYPRGGTKLAGSNGGTGRSCRENPTANGRCAKLVRTTKSNDHSLHHGYCLSVWHALCVVYVLYASCVGPNFTQHAMNKVHWIKKEIKWLSKIG